MKIDPDLIKLEEEDVPVETSDAPGPSGVGAGPSVPIVELSAQMRAEEAERQRLLARRNLLADENSRLVSSVCGLEQDRDLLVTTRDAIKQSIRDKGPMLALGIIALGLETTGEDLQVHSGLLRMMNDVLTRACLPSAINSAPDIISVRMLGRDQPGIRGALVHPERIGAFRDDFDVSTFTDEDAAHATLGDYLT